MIDVTVRGQTLRLFPEKGAYWIERKTIFVADTHFGKSAAFRRRGIPIPAGTTDADLTRLGRLLDATRAERAIFLGDLVHEGRATDEKTLEQLSRWRADRSCVDMVLILGNHDAALDRIGAALSLHVYAQREEPPFILRHDPPRDRLAGGANGGLYALTGHVHPAVSLFDNLGGRLRAPCFWFTPTFAVLPAFGGFTGCYEVAPAPDDGVYVVGDAELAQVQAFQGAASAPGAQTFARRVNG